MLRVAAIYHIWPHYRAAVMAAMDRSTAIAYSFLASGEPYCGILHADTAPLRRFVRAPFRKVGPLLWQGGAVRAALSRDYDALVLLADMHFVSTWVAAVIARARGLPVLFWGHGWLRAEPPVKAWLRNAFFRLADHLLVYGPRAARLGAASGYPAERISVVFNSLDVDKADEIVARLDAGIAGQDRPQARFADPARPLLICTARLTPACRFDLLFDAAALLRARGRPVNILLVGDGPARGELEALRDRHALDVVFHGACYDEEALGRMLYCADLTVSPGKIGLTAMHSLMYGTPAITHGNFDAQMPEVEALEPGVTGALFRQDDGESLADTIGEWLAAPRDRARTRAACRAAIHAAWNPQHQARLIERAVIETARAAA